MNVVKTPNHRYVSRRGNPVTVYQTRVMRPHANGVMMARAEAVRTWAVVCGVEVEVPAGCAYMAVAAVSAAGY